MGLFRVERQRTELEENIRKLRKSLQHWQSWEIEYEGLREEIASLPNGSSTNDVLAIARDFRAELVNDKELQNIVGGGAGPHRNQGQIVDLLAKRVEYVSRNAHTIEKQLSDAQKKRNALLLAEEPDYRDDAGLPLTDITEELDEHGNVVSSKLETSASKAPHLVDVLKKAGVKDLFEQDGIITASKTPSNGVKERQHEMPRGEESASNNLYDTKLTADGDSIARGHPAETPAEEPISPDLHGQLKNAKGEYNSSTTNPETGMLAPSEYDSIHDATGQVSVGSKATSNERNEVKEDEVVTTAYPNDTPDEAALRREMLQYGLGDVGAIVAELELEENETDSSFEEEQAALSFDSDFDEDDIEDEGGLEDEKGMVKHPGMSRKYLEKMKQLEEKHGIRGMQNLGPDASKLPKELQSEFERPPAAEAARKAALARANKSRGAAAPATGQTDQDPLKPKKKVAFAADLDIAPETGPLTALRDVSKNRPAKLSLIEPIKDSIIERQSSSVPAEKTQVRGQTTIRKPSKFKAARIATPQTPLLPPSPTSHSPQSAPNDKSETIMPSHKTLTESIVERDITTKPSPPDPDGLDDEIHHKEIVGEYYKLRNRMIQQQGGFVGEGAAENYGEEFTPLSMVDEDGKEKKISRFKAARLK